MKKINNFFKFFLKNHPAVFLVVILLLLALEIGFWLLYGGGLVKIKSYFYSNNHVSGIILFEGADCLHCIKVDNFIKDNNIGSKIKFTTLEVFDNAHNADILSDKAQICGLNIQHIGVPFLWDGTRCIIGYVDIIDFFDKAAKNISSVHE